MAPSPLDLLLALRLGYFKNLEMTLGGGPGLTNGFGTPRFRVLPYRFSQHLVEQNEPPDDFDKTTRVLDPARRGSGGSALGLPVTREG
jgi:hypothetical protein